jgi:hypothetical protein
MYDIMEKEHFIVVTFMPTSIWRGGGDLKRLKSPKINQFSITEV